MFLFFGTSFPRFVLRSPVFWLQLILLVGLLAFRLGGHKAA